MSNPVDPLINNTQARIAALERELELLRAELAGLEKARVAVEDAGLLRQNGHAPSQKRQPGERRTRALKPMWRRVLAHIGQQPQATAPNEEVWAFIERERLPIRRGTMRSQLASYTNLGYLERLESGACRLTERGAVAAGLDVALTADSREAVPGDNADEPGAQRAAKPIEASAMAETGGEPMRLFGT